MAGNRTFADFPVTSAMSLDDLLLIWTDATAINEAIKYSTFIIGIGTLDTFSGLTTTDKTLVGAINEVSAAVIAEDIFDRTVTTITPKVSGDDLEMGDGDILADDFTSELGYRIKDEIFAPGIQIGRFWAGTIGATPGSESSGVFLQGINDGSQRVFVEWRGHATGPVQDDELYLKSKIIHFEAGAIGAEKEIMTLRSGVVPAIDLIANLVEFESDTSGANVFEVRYKSDWDSVQSDFYTCSMQSTNTSSAYKIFAEDRVSATVATAGVEDGIHDFYVMENGTSTKYLALNGNTAKVDFYKEIDSVLDINTQSNFISGTALNILNSGSTLGTYSAIFQSLLVDATPAAEDADTQIFGLTAGSNVMFMKHTGTTDLVDINKPTTVAGSITSNLAGVDMTFSMENASSVTKVLLDTNGDSTFSGGDVVMTEELIVSTPGGLYAYGAAYTTGANLNATPASVAVTLTESVDVGTNWAVNSPATGEVTYSGPTRYFSVQCNLTVNTATGGTPSTITVKLQKQVGAGGWVDVVGGEVDRYLSSTNDTGSLCLGAVVSMASADDLRLEIASSSDTPTYLFNHVNFIVSDFV